VEAFATKLQDVRANKGVMVSTKGFDEGARAQAEQHNITLFSYREAVETDWEKVSAGSVWVTFTTEEFIPDVMLAELTDGTVTQIAPLEELYTQGGGVLFTGFELAGSMIEAHPFLAHTYEAASKRGPGRMWISGRLNSSVGPIFVQRASGQHQLDQITIQGDMVIQAYPTNPIFEEGHVIEDALTGQQPYTEVSSAPFNAQAIINSQEGRDVTIEEYRVTMGRNFYIPPEATTDDAQFRLTITSPGIGSQQ